MARASRRGSASRDGALLHAASQERRPSELEVANARPCQLTRLLLAGRGALHAHEVLLGHEDAVALDLELGQVEGAVQDGRERVAEILVLGDDRGRSRRGWPARASARISYRQWSLDSK